jgi:hypothetical protein
MAAQNLISAAISAETKTSINSHIDGLNDDLHFTIQIEPGDKTDYIKVGNTYLPFIDLAHEVVTSHPEILPGIFDKTEFETDYSLAQELRPVSSKLNELTKAVDNTYFAATSDLMVGALEVYAAARQNVDKIPGLDVTVDKMKVFFKRSKKITPQE